MQRCSVHMQQFVMCRAVLDMKWNQNQEDAILMNCICFYMEPKTWLALLLCWDEDWRTACLQPSVAPAPLPTLQTAKQQAGRWRWQELLGNGEAHSPSGSPHSVHCDSKRGPKRDNRRLMEAHICERLCLCMCVWEQISASPPFTVYRNVNNCYSRFSSALFLCQKQIKTIKQHSLVAPNVLAERCPCAA